MNSFIPAVIRTYINTIKRKNYSQLIWNTNEVKNNANSQNTFFLVRTIFFFVSLVIYIMFVIFNSTCFSFVILSHPFSYDIIVYTQRIIISRIEKKLTTTKTLTVNKVLDIYRSKLSHLLKWITGEKKNQKIKYKRKEC